jgi:hypothetical protein
MKSKYIVEIETKERIKQEIKILENQLVQNKDNGLFDIIKDKIETLYWVLGD